MFSDRKHKRAIWSSREWGAHVLSLCVFRLLKHLTSKSLLNFERKQTASSLGFTVSTMAVRMVLWYYTNCSFQMVYCVCGLWIYNYQCSPQELNQGISRTLWCKGNLYTVRYRIAPWHQNNGLSYNYSIVALCYLLSPCTDSFIWLRISWIVEINETYNGYYTCSPSSFLPAN